MTTRDTIYSVDASCTSKQHLSVLGEGVTQLPPESDGSGNVEYKVRIIFYLEYQQFSLLVQLSY
ncbi:hypothetical protein GGF41_003246 [Coemansia sp. RSA 2531]|nr:hypothetical protein GGF41_003246 [Coemansia sp. RSA 2531]